MKFGADGFAILVEGFLDLIVPYQFGIRNVVASLGTALTPEQVKLLGRFARKVVVNYDGDRAGVQAAKRAIEILLAEDLEVKVLVLPDNADPDEFIRKHGASEYQQRRGEAQPHIQFVIDQAVRDRNLQQSGREGCGGRRSASRTFALSAVGFRSASTLTLRWTRCALRMPRSTTRTVAVGRVADRQRRSISGRR